MTTSWTLQFISDHPVVALGMSFPTACVLITWAWLFACQIENSINLVLRLANILSNTIVITFRGYAPQSIEAAAVEEKTKDE